MENQASSPQIVGGVFWKFGLLSFHQPLREKQILFSAMMHFKTLLNESLCKLQLIASQFDPNGLAILLLTLSECRLEIRVKVLRFNLIDFHMKTIVIIKISLREGFFGHFDGGHFIESGK